ncbi:MAG: hypothetical protein ABI162_08105 [Luteolibacter sp.]
MKPISAATLAALAGTLLTSADPALTIYNQNFAVVRDPTRKTDLRILEQSYRGDVVSQDLLLSLNEGKEIDLLQRDRDTGRETIVRGKIIRSGYTPNYAAYQRYGSSFAQSQTSYGNSDGGGSPIIEVNGQLRFTLPGEPQFPTLGDDTVLKPTLTWQLASDRATKLDAELSYITGGMSWQAAYNLISPEKSNTLDIVGWVTIDNQSGKTFDNAAIKLVAGDVSKLQPEGGSQASGYGGGLGQPKPKDTTVITEKALDE